MPRTAEQLHADALAIWQAGVSAVRSDRLVRKALRVEGSALVLAGETLELASIGRIVVVGAGKAGAGMATAVEEVLGRRLLAEKGVTGWVNVPADCVRSLARIHLHAARPPGLNEPTQAGAEGAAAILRLVQSLGPKDLCLCLISGGGSALMPAPIEGITLEDKLAVTRHLSAAGANIEQLNTVRKQLSRIKGGGLARACRAGRLVALIISDVLGDPLPVIASGPTVEDASTPEDALAILEQFGGRAAGISPRVFDYFERKAASPPCSSPGGNKEPTVCSVSNYIIGNNAVAVDAAGREAERRGYTPALDQRRELGGIGRRRRPASGADGAPDARQTRTRLPDQRRRAGRPVGRAFAARAGWPQSATRVGGSRSPVEGGRRGNRNSLRRDRRRGRSDRRRRRSAGCSHPRDRAPIGPRSGGFALA